MENPDSDNELADLRRRVASLEGRLNAAMRDAYAMRLEMMRAKERRAAASFAFKLLGSVVASLSILIQIGRAVLL